LFSQLVFPTGQEGYINSSFSTVIYSVFPFKVDKFVKSHISAEIPEKASFLKTIQSDRCGETDVWDGDRALLNTLPLA
jgi:hypothetical protein